MVDEARESNKDLIKKLKEEAAKRESPSGFLDEEPVAKRKIGDVKAEHLPGAVEIGPVRDDSAVTKEEFERQGKEPVIWVRKERDRKRFKLKDRKRAVAWASSGLLSILAVALLFVVGFFVLRIFDFTIVSRTPVHWHTTLNIRVGGETITIPPSVGLLNNLDSPIHTHEPDNVIHWHIDAPVRERDLYIGRFLDVWEKDIREWGEPVVLVNGVISYDMERHSIRDGDIIEIVYE